MAESVVSFLVGKLDSFIGQEVGLLKNIRKEVMDIKYEFESIQALLKDADAKGELEQGEQVKVWLKEVRHVAFEIEDVLDEFLLRYHAHQPHVLGLGTCGFLNKFKYFFKHLMERRDLAARIQDIKIRVEDVSKRRKRYNLSNLGQGSTIPSSSVAITRIGRDPRLDALFLAVSQVVGIDKLRDQLIGWLVDDPDSKTVVISVFGPGGLGKTTLVKKVYDSKVVKEHFACSAWITVSQSFEIKSLLRHLILQPLKEEDKKELLPQLERSDAVELKEILRSSLLSQRYIVVLDDIWKDDVWKELKSALPDNKCGSRIIVTTRSQDVAKFCVQNPRYAFELQPLKPDDARALFVMVAFKSGVQNSQHLSKIIEKFLNKCKGLPLAIVTIAGVLASKDTIHWGQIYGDFDSSLDDINTILSLSYNDLSYHLKTCLLYFSIFPEDYSIRCSRLLRLWVAEGFVDLETRQGIHIFSTKEQAVERYLNELIARSLVQVEKIDKSGRVRTCRIHDLLHDFLLKKAQDQDFVAFLAEWRHRIETNGDTVRRLSFLNKENDVEENNKKFFSHVRSLFAFGEVTSFNPCTISTVLSGGGMKLVKVLDLEGAPMKGFPCEIVTHMFFLRYLSLRDSKLNFVPDSVGKLVNLETLDLKYTHVFELPVGILKLQRLRHIISEMSVRLPEGIGTITNLEKLKRVKAQRGIGEELGMLTQLRTLSITKVVGEEGRRVLASIEKMKYLHSLALVGSRVEILELQNVRCPPLLLQRLRLDGLLLDESLLQWIPSLENLTKLTLQFSHIKDSAVVEGLQRLPNLVELLLGFEAFDGKELLLNKGGFPRLRHLRLVGLNELKFIRIEEGAMPGIQSLMFYKCRKLEKVPVGMQHLTTLKSIEYLLIPSNFMAEINDYGWKDGHSPLVKCLAGSRVDSL